MRKSARITGLALLALAICVVIIVYALWREDRRGLLTVSFLDVGQGDAIFLDSPVGRQMLIDGGPNSAILKRLSDVMPWWDRSIDVVVATHPDIDHSSGLYDVFARYRVTQIFLPSVVGSTDDWATILKTVRTEGGVEYIAERGQVIDLGGGAYAQVLFPDRALPGVETNTASTIVRIVYGDTAFMLTGDAPVSIEKYLVALDGEKLKSHVLKAGHHGSRTSSHVAFISAVDPEYAVFSRGCDNKYGHPVPEIVERYQQLSVFTLDTCTEGTITFVSDGSNVSRR